MKAHAQNLIASVAAILFTTASLGALYHNVGGQQASATEISSKVVTLATIHVYPSAAERRAAALLPHNSNVSAGSSAAPIFGQMDGGFGSSEQIGLIGSQLAMPYYSFDKKLGRISKE